MVELGLNYEQIEKIFKNSAIQNHPIFWFEKLMRSEFEIKTRKATAYCRLFAWYLGAQTNGEQFMLLVIANRMSNLLGYSDTQDLFNYGKWL